MKKTSKEIILGFMIFMLLSPTLSGIFWGKQQFLEINENRNRMKWEEVGCLLDTFSDQGQTFKKIEEFYNDNFSLRDFFIRTKNQIEFTLFNKASGVYIGQDGYMSYVDVVAKEQIKNESLPDIFYEELVFTLQRKRKILQEQDIEFLFMFPPQKNTVFPERTQNFPVKRPEFTAYDKMVEYIERSDINDNFIDVGPILEKSELQHPTYYKTDFHWNAYGATKAFQSAINTLLFREGIDYCFTDDEYDVIDIPNFRGGQLNEVNILQDIQETAIGCKSKKESQMMLVENNENGYFRHYTNNIDSKKLKTIVFIGDSYTDYMLSSNSGILDLFNDVYFIHVDTAENVLDKIPQQIDYIIFEKIESAMPQYIELLDQAIQ